MTHLLEVKNLVTRFRVEAGVIHAVNGISYSLEAGESMAIVGESGSGKTVGVQSIMGLLPSPPARIEQGQALFMGRDLLQMAPEQLRKVRGKDIALIFQDPMTFLNPVLSIGRQLTEGLQTHTGISRKQAEERAIDLLAQVGIPRTNSRLADYPHQFSGGQRQRIGIAMALMCNPSLLIADEPTTALDVTIQAQIVDLIRRLQAQYNMAIIWITHDLGVVAELVQKVVVMYAGFIVETAPTLSLYESTSHPYTLGLLESLPAFAGGARQKLNSIEGLPPDLLKPATGCPFAPRCRFAEERCWQEIPSLMPAGHDHFAACFRWNEVRETAKARALPGGAE